MAKRKPGQTPRLEITISSADRDAAIRSNVGACLIADAIKRQYPAYTAVTVDMATVRLTDLEAGERYTYLTPPPAQYVLLAFDQGWPSHPVETIRFQRAVKVTPVVRYAAKVAKRAARLAELEAKETAGTLGDRDRQALTLLRNTPEPTPRATAHGRPTVDANGVVRGGRPLKINPHPNLLRSRRRHYGAKMAAPDLAFAEAVEAAVAERLAAEANT